MTKKIVSFLILLCTFLSIASPANATEPKLNKDGRVLILSMPHVSWNHMLNVKTPAIDSLIKKGSIATTSVRTIGNSAYSGSGYASISAGERAVAPDAALSTFLSPQEKIDGVSAKDLFRREQGKTKIESPAALAPGFQLTIRRNASSEYKSKVGLFAEALDGNNRSIAAFGNADSCFLESVECYARSVGYVASDSNGIIRNGDLSREGLLKNKTDTPALDMKVLGDKTQKALEKNDVVITECSNLERIDQSRSKTKQNIYWKNFNAAIKECDSMIGQVMKDIDLSKDNVYIISPSSPSVQKQTTIFVSAGKGIEPGYTSSSTTRREGVVTLVDLSPTILSSFDIKIPEDMGDNFLSWSGNAKSIQDRKEYLAKINDQSKIREMGANSVIAFMSVMIFIAVLISILSLSRVTKLRNAAKILSLMTMSLPILVILVQPLMRSVVSPLRFMLLFIVVSFLIALVLKYLASKVGYVKVLLGFAAFNLIVLIGDIITGGNLEFMSFIGNSPIQGGRFAGWGNRVFAIVVICTIILIAMAVQLSAHLPAKQKNKVHFCLLAFALLILFLDGAPFLGSDVGGVLSLTPTVFIIGMMLFNKKIGIKPLLIAGVSTLLVFSAFAAIDLSRPASERSHLGRFVESVFKGNAGSVIQRKLAESLRSIGVSYYIYIVLVAVAFFIFLYFTQEKYLQRLYNSYVGFKFIVWPGLIAGVLGFALNDSGIAIPAVMLVIVTPVVVLLLLQDLEEPTSSKKLKKNESSTTLE